MTDKRTLYIVGGFFLLIIGYVWLRGIKGAVADTVKAGADAAAGVVIGTGEAVGIPQTDDALCEQACAAGQGWAASKYCSATRFASYLWNGK